MDYTFNSKSHQSFSVGSKLKKLLLITTLMVVVTNRMLAQTIPSYVPKDSLAAWWPFNGNANDASGNGNHGAVNGPTLTTDRNGITNTAYNFDGTADYIDCGNSPKLNFRKSISISIWFYANNFSNEHGLVSNFINGGGIDLITGSPYSVPPSDKIRWLNQGGFLYSNSISSSRWYHLVAIFNSSKKEKLLYLNGSLFAKSQTNISNLDTTTSNFYIGAHLPTIVNYWSWDGKIDDIGIWNRALDSNEIFKLYTSCDLTFTSNPSNAKGQLYGTAIFAVASNDTNTTFQWQADSGQGFLNLSNGGQYAGVNKDTLIIQGLAMKNHNQKYRCIISSGKCADTSSAALLEVCGKITLQPQNTPSKIGSNALFVSKSNDSSALYRWQTDLGQGYFDLSNIGQYAGVNKDTLTIYNLTMKNHNQNLRCIISSGNCADTTFIALLEVCGKITLQPQNTQSNIGSNALFVSKSNDSSAFYRWQTDLGQGYFDLSNIGQYAGVNKDTLTIYNLTMKNHNQKLRCIISSGSCTDTTFIALLEVCGKITLQPQNTQSNIGSNALFVCKSNDSSALYRWQTDLGQGYFDLSNIGQYAGVNKDTLNIYNLTMKNHNQKLRCIISSGSCTDTSFIALLEVCGKITMNPQNTQSQTGSNALFSCQSDDSYALYQWQTDLGIGFQNLKSAGQYSGVNNDTITISNLTVNNSNQPFRCIVSSGACTDTSGVAILTLRTCQHGFIRQPQSLSSQAGSTVQFTVTAKDSNANYQWQSDLGIGFQNLNSVGQYSGAYNDTLNISNISSNNNNQPFRCIVSAGSCIDTSATAIITIANASGMNELFYDGGFTIYPNPASNQIQLNVGVELLGKTFEIFDLTGKQLQTGKIINVNTIIDIGNLPEGLYMIAIGANRKQAFKILKN